MEVDEPMHLLDLPIEILEKIIHYLPFVADRKNLRLTCQQLFDVCNQERCCKNEKIVWRCGKKQSLIADLSYSKRSCFNLIIESGVLGSQNFEVSTFFEQQGARIRLLSLVFPECVSSLDLFEQIITCCEALTSLSLNGYFFKSSFLLEPKSISRPAVTNLKLALIDKILEQSPNVSRYIFQRILYTFPCVKHLIIRMVRSIHYSITVFNVLHPVCLDFVMNFSYLESLKLDTSLDELLAKEPQFLDSLPRLKKLCIFVNSYNNEDSSDISTSWRTFTSRLKNVSFFQVCGLDVALLHTQLPLGGKLKRLDYFNEDCLALNLEAFKTLVSSNLRVIKIKTSTIIDSSSDLAKGFEITKANKTVTDLIIDYFFMDGEEFYSNDETTTLMALFPSYFHGLIHLTLSWVNDAVLLSIFKYQKNLRSLVLKKCEDCTVAGFCGAEEDQSRNSITSLQNLEHLEILDFRKEVIDAERFQARFNFPRLKYLKLHLSSKSEDDSPQRIYEIPVAMLKPCTSLEAAYLDSSSLLTLPSYAALKSIFQDLKSLNYLHIYSQFDHDRWPECNYVNLKHFYWIDTNMMAELKLLRERDRLYYDEVLDRTIISGMVSQDISLCFPKIGFHTINWIKV